MSVAGWLDAMHSEYPPAHRLVWMCLESHANNARCWQITDREIADEMHLGINTVSRAIRDLEADEIISAERRKRQPTIYTMRRKYPPPKGKLNGHFGGSSPELTPQSGDSTKELTHQNAVSTTTPDDALTPQGGDSTGELTPQNADTKTPTESNREEKDSSLTPLSSDPAPRVRVCEGSEDQSKRSENVVTLHRRSSAWAPGDPPGWERFKAAWPPIDGSWRMAALDYRQVLAEGVAPDVLAEAAERFPFRRDRGTRFVVHPSTWLRERRWETEIPTEPEAESLEALQAAALAEQQAAAGGTP